MKLGDVVHYEGKYGIIIDNCQSAWGAQRFKILFADDVVKYVWDKHMKNISERKKMNV